MVGVELRWGEMTQPSITYVIFPVIQKTKSPFTKQQMKWTVFTFKWKAILLAVLGIKFPKIITIPLNTWIPSEYIPFSYLEAWEIWMYIIIALLGGWIRETKQSQTFSTAEFEHCKKISSNLGNHLIRENNEKIKSRF